jgi:hypothetical protein
MATVGQLNNVNAGITEDDDDAMMNEMTDEGLTDDAMMAAFLSEDGAMMVEEQAGASAHNVRQVSDTTEEANNSNTSSTTPGVDPTSTTQTSSSIITAEPFLTGRPSIPLYLSCNPDYLSDYQCLIRKHIELFEACEKDVNNGRIKGRNKPIVLGQVGIRCMFCAHLYPPEDRARGAMYYPHKLAGIYQAAQILNQGHLLELCPFVPKDLRVELKRLKEQKSYATAGKDYWANTAKALNVFEDQYGLRYEARLGMVFHANNH